MDRRALGDRASGARIVAVLVAATAAIACGKVLDVGDYHAAEPRLGDAEAPAAMCPEGEASPGSSGGCIPAGVPSAACRPLEYDGTNGCRYGTSTCPTSDRVPAPTGNCQLLQCQTQAPSGYDQYADSGYPGNDSDGSIRRPWKKIQDALDHAPDSGQVYVAGAPIGSTMRTYEENVVLRRGISLSGACRSLAEIHGRPDEPTITVIGDAPHASVSDVAVSGGSTGILALGRGVGDGGSSAPALELARIGVQDVSGPGLDLRDVGASVTGSYVRRVVGTGVISSLTTALSGTSLTIDASSIQSVTPSANDARGGCVRTVRHATLPQRLSVSVLGSLLEDCTGSGIYASGTDLAVTSSVIRRVRGSDRGGVAVSGDGVLIEQDPLGGVGFATPGGTDATLVLTGSLLEDLDNTGVSLRNVATATVSNTTIRTIRGRGGSTDAGAGPCLEGGIGLLAIAERTDDADAGYRFRSRVRISNSLVTGARLAGIELMGVSATIDASIVRGTRAGRRPDCPEALGDGIAVYSRDRLSTDLVVTGTRVEETERAALSSFGPGGHVVIEGAAIGCGAFGLAQDERAASILVPDPRSVVCACGGPGRTCATTRTALAPMQVGWQ